MPNEDTCISYGKRKGNKITYTRLKSMPVHEYYEEYHHVKISNDIISKIVNMSEKNNSYHAETESEYRGVKICSIYSKP